mmetsp:Transcript_10060/g.16206  ORF Transcript_10060/g.16206 Transcript_10060/m.16206 type:complete len:81 (+) Transcript_10060:1121-1363(+)
MSLTQRRRKPPNSHTLALWRYVWIDDAAIKIFCFGLFSIACAASRHACCDVCIVLQQQGRYNKIASNGLWLLLTAISFTI